MSIKKLLERTNLGLLVANLLVLVALLGGMMQQPVVAYALFVKPPMNTI